MQVEIRVFSVCWLLLVCVSIAFGAQSHVVGRVIDSESGQPIARGLVRVTLPTEGVLAETSTDERGHFEFDRVSSANYSVSAYKEGYVQILPFSVTGGDADGNGTDEVHIQLELTRAAVIAGRVIDSSGRPIGSARVAPIVQSPSSGTVQLLAGTPVVKVDDQGNYRLYGLAPGRYRIAAIAAGNVDARLFRPVFFPGVSELAKADIVRLRAGETSTADFVIPNLQGYAVFGGIAGVPTGWPMSRLAISLFTSDGYAVATVQSDDKGKFGFDGVPAGSYQLVAAGPVVATGGFGSMLGNAPLFGRLRFDVAGEQTGELAVELHPGGSVRGEMVFEREGEGGPFCYSAARISLEPIDPVPSGLAPTVAVHRGGFQLKTLAPAHYRVAVTGLSRNCFVKEVRLGDQMASDRILISNGEAYLKIVLTTRDGGVVGTVRRGKTAVAGLTVVLVPESQDGVVRAQEQRTAISGRDGNYHIAGLAPGRYRIMALEHADSIDYLDPAFWVEHKAQIIEAAIDSGIEAQIDLHAVQPDENWR